MSVHNEYRCDGCATAGAARVPKYVAFGVQLPKGWHRWEDQHFCSYDCLIERLKELEAASSPQALALKNAFLGDDPAGNS